MVRVARDHKQSTNDAMGSAYESLVGRLRCPEQPSNAVKIEGETPCMTSSAIQEELCFDSVHADLELHVTNVRKGRASPVTLPRADEVRARFDPCGEHHRAVLPPRVFPMGSQALEA